MQGPEERKTHITPTPTNVAIATRLGCDHSTVSRIRSGQRYPSRELMRKIEASFGWKVVHQLGLLPDRGRNTRYASQFEKVIAGSVPGGSDA